MISLSYGERNALGVRANRLDLEWPQWQYDGRISHTSRRRVYTSKTFGVPITNFQGYDPQTFRVSLIYRHDLRQNPTDAHWYDAIGAVRALAGAEVDISLGRDDLGTWKLQAVPVEYGQMSIDPAIGGQNPVPQGSHPNEVYVTLELLTDNADFSAAPPTTTRPDTGGVVPAPEPIDPGGDVIVG